MCQVVYVCLHKHNTLKIPSSSKKMVLHRQNYIRFKCDHQIHHVVRVSDPIVFVRYYYYDSIVIFMLFIIFYILNKILSISYMVHLLIYFYYITWHIIVSITSLKYLLFLWILWHVRWLDQLYITK